MCLNLIPVTLILCLQGYLSAVWKPHSIQKEREDEKIERLFIMQGKVNGSLKRRYPIRMARNNKSKLFGTTKEIFGCTTTGV